MVHTPPRALPACIPSGSPAPRRSGFSLVELLVVVAIISVLVGLLLPAVQAARESSRRTQCSNNVRQLAVACQQHLDAQGHFPTGGWGSDWAGDPDAGFGSKQPGGWLYALLPYVDESALRNTGSGQGAGVLSAAARQVFETQVGKFACPTRGVSAAVVASGSSYFVSGTSFTPTLAGRSDYAANGGDVATASLFNPAGSAATATTVLAMAGSVAGSSAGNDKATGVVFRGSTVRSAHLRDGMSNVYLLGERFVLQGQSQTSTSLGNQDGWLVGFDDDTIRLTAASPEQDGTRAATGFEGRFGGPHAAGFPMAMADGSVQLIPYDIDPTTHQRLGNRRDGQIASLPTN